MAAQFSLVFHTKVSKIDERLYLGDMMDAQNKTMLQKLGITHVLNMAKESPCFHPTSFEYFQVPAIDIESFDIGKYLQDAADFIAEGLKNGGVLAHCAYGISRGSSAVIAYLIKYRKMGFEEARAFVQAKRSHICPNSGFVKKLKKMQKELGIKGNESRALRLRKEVEETNSLFTDLGLGLSSKKAKRSVTLDPSKKLPLLTSGKKTNPMAAINRIKEKLFKQDEELAEFKNYANNFGIGFQITPVKISSTTTQPWNTQSREKISLKAKGKIHSNLNTKQKSKKAAGYCCKNCSRMLTVKDEIIRHGGIAEIKCDSLFVKKQGWMKGDSSGCQKNLVCPNPRCKVIVGQICQQGLSCCCGFSDNPGYTLALDNIRTYYE